MEPHTNRADLDAGLHVSQGADWQTLNPDPNPFDPSMTGTLAPSEAVSLEQAIAICTIEGAWILGVENELGSIEVGSQ